MNRESLAQWCARGSFGLALAALLFAPLATGAVRAPDFLIVQALAIGATLLGLAWLWLGAPAEILLPPVAYAVLAFAGYAVVRYFTSDVEYVARLELARLLVYALLFFLLLQHLRSPAAARTLVFALVLLAAGVAVYALFQFSTHSDRVWHFISPYKGRAGGTYICPNHLAGFLEMLLPLALAGALTARLKLPAKIFLGGAALLLVAGLAVTLSRGGWLAATGGLVALAALLGWRRNFRLPLLLGLAVVLVVAGVCYSNSPAIRLRAQRLLSAEPSVKTVENIRFELWQPARALWGEYFWFGAGLAHFDVRYREFRPQNVQMRAEHAHNDYLEALADWGILGAALAGAAAALAGGRALKICRAGNAVDAGRAPAFALGATAGLFALALHSVVDFNLHVPANAMLAGALLALLASHTARATDARALRAGARMALTALLVVAVVFLAAQGWRRGQEELWLQRAARAQDFSPEQSAAWRAAFTCEPKNFETTYALGEVRRIQSMDGNHNYAALAAEAIGWYERGMTLNPHDGNNWLRRGMCRDWLEDFAAAAPDFARAEALDPNGYYTVAHVGWHHVQTGNYVTAREYFERSLRLTYANNQMAEKYLVITEGKLREAAAAGR